MYLVTQNGVKLPVDDSQLDYEKDFIPFTQNVGLYTDNTVLKPVWILQLQKSPHMLKKTKPVELEFVAERAYDHPPTQEEILWAMSAHGLVQGDVATVTQGFELGFD